MMSLFAFTKMADSQKLSAKKKKKKKHFAINLHIFWFDFSKAIRNDIVLHILIRM